MTFEDLVLIQPIRRALNDKNYQIPTPIQSKTIPHALEGKDVLGCAQTGTGKTAAFALPILNFLGGQRPKRKSKSPTALILAPTRELANQIGKSFQDYGKHLKLRHSIVYGGVSQFRQVKSVKNGVDWMIATPGRLLDLIQQKHIDLGNVKYFVLDEADRMLDMGFLPELKKIIGRLPEQRQSLFFSATIPDEISEFAGTLLTDPVRVTVAAKQQKIDQIQQVIKKIDQPKKVAALIELLRQDDVGPTIVFTRTKRGADKIAKKLNDAKINSAAIHGDKTQNARERALKSFAKNRVSVLVATDVASRGIDIRGVTHVVNYDAPDDPETYIHRIGRTGRAGSHGIAITFCSPAEKSKIRAVEKLLGVDLLGEKPRKSRRKPKHSSARSKSRPGKSRSKSGKSRAFSSKSNARSGKSNADSNNSSANSGKSNAHSGKSKKVTGNRKGKAFFGRKRRKSKSSRQKAAVV